MDNHHNNSIKFDMLPKLQLHDNYNNFILKKWMVIDGYYANHY